MSTTHVQPTPKQQQFYDTFVSLVFEDGRTQWPSVREMTRAMNLSSTSEAHRYFLTLTARGYLEHEGGQRRPYTLPGWRFVTSLVKIEETQ